MLARLTKTSLLFCALVTSGCFSESPTAPEPLHNDSAAVGSTSSASKTDTQQERISLKNGQFIPIIGDCRPDDMNAEMRNVFSQRSGADLADETEILDVAMAAMECERRAFDGHAKALFTDPKTGQWLTDIDWNPSHDAQTLRALSSRSRPLLVANDFYDPGTEVIAEPFAMIGQKDGARYAVFGGHPMRNSSWGYDVGPQMHTLIHNVLGWLSARDDLQSGQLNIVIAHMKQQYWFPDQVSTRQWLDTEFGERVSYNTAQACNGAAALQACLDAPIDVLMISNDIPEADIDAVTGVVEQALKDGVPVLYMHLDGHETPASKALLAKMDVAHKRDNYWKRLRLTDYRPDSRAFDVPDSRVALLKTLHRFKDDRFSIDFSTCENNGCPAENDFNVQFKPARDELRAMFGALDQSGEDIFDQRLRFADQALTLLGDHWRAKAVFPMDKMTTPQGQFLRALFADSAVHRARKNQPAQADLGNFSPQDLSGVAGQTVSVSLTAQKDYSAAGVYALPGRTITVTRTDESAVNTWVRVNLVRDGSGRIFNTDSYRRPEYLSSKNMEIGAGQSLSFSTPHGGPVFIRFDGAGDQVSFTFDNVAQHAVWRGPEDTGSFNQKVAAGTLNWVQIITPQFQIHSRLDKLDETLSNPLFPGGVETIATATETYVHGWPHALAGYQGPGIPVIQEVHDWAAAKGLDIETLDWVKHMNADQAICATGCAGNPYDAFWSFDPLGHGDIHEMGHGLERGRFRFDGQDYHTSTNPYAYYSKWQFFKATGDARVDQGCQNLPYQSLFERAQAAKASADPAAYWAANPISRWNYGAGITLQMMMGAQDLGIFADGYHMLAALHIMDREFNLADDNDAAWLAKRDALGFGGIDRTTARALSNNDWNLIALSWIMGRDMTDYLSVWGHEFSQAAKDHVSAFGYAAFPTDFYIASPKQHCRGLSGIAKLPIDGTQSWPIAQSTRISKAELKSEFNHLAAGHICREDEAKED